MRRFSCEGITKCYEGVPVVEGIDLSLQSGERGCLLGPSGVGKTTLMGVLSGVDRPKCGRVLLGDEEITGKPGRVSYMLQKDLLFPYKTVIDNVSLPLLLAGTPKAQARARAAEQFELFGLAGYEKKYPHQLSGGMRQRAALLRTHLCGNDVILLDEPFSSLDAITKRQMHRWFIEMVEKLSMTTLLITHDVDEALVLADTIYILAGQPGKITAKFAVDKAGSGLEDFSLTPEFLRQKQEIIASIN